MAQERVASIEDALEHGRGHYVRAPEAHLGARDQRGGTSTEHGGNPSAARKWKSHDSGIRPGRVRTRISTSRAQSGGRNTPLDGTRDQLDSAWRNSIDRENGPGTTRCRRTASRRADADRYAPERWQVHNLRRR